MSQVLETGAVDGGGAHDRPAHLAHHFDTPEQQFETAKLGMWVFLVTEILFFSGLFCAYAVFRANNPEIFLYGHAFLDKTLGAANTIILITSSFTMAWAVRCAQIGARKGLIINLILTFVCAAGFMGIKAVEYSQKVEHGLLWGNKFNPEVHAVEGSGSGAEAAAAHVEEPPVGAHIFFGIYFGMTGLHGLHVLIGMGLILWLLIRAMKGHFGPGYFTPVDIVGLYWHLVDLIWIFLFPLLYLIH